MRIFSREGGNLEDIKAFTAMRDSEDSRRYMKLYGIDNEDYGFCDLIVDTDTNSPEKIVEMILSELEKRNFIS